MRLLVLSSLIRNVSEPVRWVFFINISAQTTDQPQTTDKTTLLLAQHNWYCYFTCEFIFVIVIIFEWSSDLTHFQSYHICLVHNSSQKQCTFNHTSLFTLICYLFTQEEIMSAYWPSFFLYIYDPIAKAQSTNQTVSAFSLLTTDFVG